MKQDEWDGHVTSSANDKRGRVPYLPKHRPTPCPESEGYYDWTSSLYHPEVSTPGRTPLRLGPPQVRSLANKRPCPTYGNKFTVFPSVSALLLLDWKNNSSQFKWHWAQRTPILRHGREKRTTSLGGRSHLGTLSTKTLLLV